MKHVKPSAFNEAHANANGWDLQSHGKMVKDIQYQCMDVPLNLEPMSVKEFNEKFRS